MAAEPLTPEQRSLRARMAANARWAATEDRVQATAKARAASRERFERQVDPDGLLDPAERARRANSAFLAHMQRLAFRSSVARSRKAAQRTTAQSKESTT